MVDIYQEIARIKAEGEEAALATVISSAGSTPRGEGAKILVKEDGSIEGSLGGGELEARVCQKAREVMKIGRPKRVHFSLTGEEVGMICGGEIEVFIEPILLQPSLYIFGGGHIALPLAKIAKLLNFKVTLIDDRDEFAGVERFSGVDEVIAGEFKEVFSRVKIDKSSYLVIVTRGHQYDELVLELALKTPARYIGMMGSRTKNETIFSHLSSKGMPPGLLQKVHAPIGLEIGAQTPEEIAVSIAAELIKARCSSLQA